MTQLNQFNGGLNQVASPNLLLVNQGVEYDNIDIAAGTLRPTLEEADTTIPFCISMYYFKDKWVTPIDCSKEYHYIEYNNSLYCNDMDGNIFFTDDGINWTPLLITEAPSALTVKAINETPPSYEYADDGKDKRIFFTVGTHPEDGTSMYEHSELSVYIYDFNLIPKLSPSTVQNIQVVVTDIASNYVLYTFNFSNFSNIIKLPQLLLPAGSHYRFTIILTGTSTYYTESVSRLSISGTQTIPNGDIKLLDFGVIDADSANRLSYMDTTEPVMLTSSFFATNGETHMATEWRIENDATGKEVYYSIDYSNLTMLKIGKPFKLEPYTSYKFSAVHIGSNGTRSNKIEASRSTAGEGSFYASSYTPQGNMNSSSGTGYTYVYTYYNSKTGFESPPSSASNSVIVTNGRVEVTGFIPSSAKGVDTINLYRLGGALTRYTKVTSLPNSSIFKYDDVKSDLDIDGAILPTAGTSSSVKLKYLNTVNGMLVGAWGNKLYYSDIAYVNRWRQLQFIGYSFDVTGIAISTSGIIVFGYNKTYIIAGTTPESFSNYLLSGSQGCINYYSIQSYSTSIIFVSNDGICILLNGEIVVASKQFIKARIYSNDIKSSAVYNDEYYLFLADKYYIFGNNKIRVETTRFPIVNSHYASYVDELAIGDGAKVYVVSRDTRLSNKYESFLPDIKTKMLVYKSPLYSENTLTKIKYFKELHIFAKEKSNLNGSISILIDNTMIGTYSIPSGYSVIKLPHTITRSNYLQFLVQSNIEILEIRLDTGRNYLKGEQG